ncbi:MAG: hypothetical protein CSA81_05510 [Acidobacteria bacterium]|nr:MAG: hypothetical protein CSA81_05510 [Acidobacteriota bacterium]PIE90954.1 MAG: hypothetical protein CR997_03600 [Acidobacteriota bacterium]
MELMIHPERSTTDQTEIEALFNQNYRTIYQTAYRICGNPMDAEDVLQTVFLRLTKRAKLPILEPNPQAYFRKAAINASYDILKTRKTRNATSLDSLPDLRSYFPDTDPEKIQRNKELKYLLRQCLAELKPQMAAVFTLKFFEGYKNKEIAHMLGLSQAFTAVLIYRARNIMKKHFSKALGGHHV